jgi:gas vesicle protein
MHRNYDHARRMAAGIAWGAVIGAGLALLFAPRSGRQLRSEFGASVDGLRTAATTRYEAMAARAGGAVANLQQTVGSAARALEARARSVAQSTSRRGRGAEPAA